MVISVVLPRGLPQAGRIFLSFSKAVLICLIRYLSRVLAVFLRYFDRGAGRDFCLLLSCRLHSLSHRRSARTERGRSKYFPPHPPGDREFWSLSSVLLLLLPSTASLTCWMLAISACWSFVIAAPVSPQHSHHNEDAIPQVEQMPTCIPRIKLSGHR